MPNFQKGKSSSENSWKISVTSTFSYFYFCRQNKQGGDLLLNHFKGANQIESLLNKFVCMLNTSSCSLERWNWKVEEILCEGNIRFRDLYRTLRTEIGNAHFSKGIWYLQFLPFHQLQLLVVPKNLQIRKKSVIMIEFKEFSPVITVIVTWVDLWHEATY